ncbi:hypothetical protein [Solitalea koreensis]|nr:hypothetical protein [Solitalea koreensis]
MGKHRDLLQKSELFVVNSFAVSPYFVDLKPANYIFLDQYFTAYDGKQTPIEAVKKTFEHLATDVSWPITIFMPAKSARNSFHLELKKSNPNINICYYNYVVAKGFKWVKHWLFSHNLAMPQCQNILNACIFIAINRKFKNVYLLGADHSWHEQLIVDNSNDIVITDKHFYNEKGKEIEMKSRAHDPKEYGIHKFFELISKAFYSYLVLRSYADSQGVNIFNSSEKSYIDAFERKSIPNV